MKNELIMLKELGYQEKMCFFFKNSYIAFSDKNQYIF